MEQNHATFPCSLQWSGHHGDSQAESLPSAPCSDGVFISEMMCLVWVCLLELELTSGNHCLAKLGNVKRVAQDWQGENSAVGSEQGC